LPKGHAADELVLRQPVTGIGCARPKAGLCELPGASAHLASKAAEAVKFEKAR
jgi:L-serine deaminase